MPTRLAAALLLLLLALPSAAHARRREATQFAGTLSLDVPMGAPMWAMTANFDYGLGAGISLRTSLVMGLKRTHESEMYGDPSTAAAHMFLPMVGLHLPLQLEDLPLVPFAALGAGGGWVWNSKSDLENHHKPAATAGAGLGWYAELGFEWHFGSTGFSISWRRIGHPTEPYWYLPVYMILKLD